MGGRQRKKLTGHMKYIYTSDWLIKLEGIGSLSHQALSEVEPTLSWIDYTVVMFSGTVC